MDKNIIEEWFPSPYEGEGLGVRYIKYLTDTAPSVPLLRMEEEALFQNSLWTAYTLQFV